MQGRAPCRSEYLADRLRGEGFSRVDAIRAKPYSPWVFFILDASETIVRRAADMAQRHPAVFSWHPEIPAQTALVPAASTAGWDERRRELP
jgi:hypothetical protein